MKQYIPETTIEEIRTRIDIVEIVSDHVLIKKHGKYYKGLCPFHPEKTPSFTVTPDKGIYHCFGCGAGGNAFAFLMETEGISFVEAVKKLAARCHVSIPEPASRGSSANSSGISGEREALRRLNALAADYFASVLRDPAKGKPAREYLRSRAFDEDVIAKYQLGWAPPAWRELLTYFEARKKIHRTQLEKAGLIKRKENSANGDTYYDRFRGRVIFPLKDARGNVAGFAGRIIVDTEEPKYLNSPETLLYKKGEMLFGLHQAKESIRRNDRVLIVEGYFDQIRADQFEVRNVVATGGTAMTPKQVALLRNHTKNVVLVFDADLAGEAAAKKGYDLLLEQNMNVEVISLPGGHDPDSFLREHGREAFLRLLDNAHSFMEYFIRKSIQTVNIDRAAGKLEVVNRVLPLLVKVKGSVERTEGVKFLAEQLRIEDQALLADLKKAVEENKSFTRESVSKERPRSYPEEFYLIHLLLSGETVAREIRARMAPDEFDDEAFRGVAELVYAMMDEACPLQIDRALDRTDNPEIRAALARIGSSPLAFDDWRKAVSDCVRKIKERNLRAKIQELRKQRNKADREGQTQVSRRLHELVREMQATLNQDEISATL